MTVTTGMQSGAVCLNSRLKVVGAAGAGHSPTSRPTAQTHSDARATTSAAASTMEIQKGNFKFNS